jgi:hypothetical protein
MTFRMRQIPRTNIYIFAIILLVLLIAIYFTSGGIRGSLLFLGMMVGLIAFFVLLAPFMTAGWRR